MNVLTDFRDLGFLKQISILGAIEEGRQTEHIPELVELYVTPVGDTAVDTMIRNCLRTLMFHDSEAVLNGLFSEHRNVRFFSMGIAADNGLKQAAPALLELAEETVDPDDLLDVLTAMSKIQAPEFLPFFRKHLLHDDPLVASLCLEMMGAYGDKESLEVLLEVIRRNEEDDRYAICELTTWSAIVALGRFGTEAALQALLSVIHHKNPTARRIVQETLLQAGQSVIPLVAPVLARGTCEEKVVALNLLGSIGNRKGCDQVIDAIEKGYLDDPNQKFAAYEAMGAMPGMKCLVCLVDALEAEDDLMVLTAVMNGLDKQINKDTAEMLRARIRADLGGPDSRGYRMMQAIVTARAVNIFALLHDDAQLSALLVEIISSTSSPVLVDLFIKELQNIDKSSAGEVVAALKLVDVKSTGKQLLAIDDSTAMRHFYTSATLQLQMAVTTAANGLEALDMLKKGINPAGRPCGPFDLIVVDMNMPVMDGIEFTRKVRELDGYGQTPILMATTESDKSQARLAKKSGINAFLSKPFTIDTLQHKIERLLGA